jgi:hypothetical protein
VVTQPEFRCSQACSGSTSSLPLLCSVWRWSVGKQAGLQKTLVTVCLRTSVTDFPAGDASGDAQAVTLSFKSHDQRVPGRGRPDARTTSRPAQTRACLNCSFDASELVKLNRCHAGLVPIRTIVRVPRKGSGNTIQEKA